MTATYHSLRDTRLPKATKAIGLLRNLARYDHTEVEARELVNTINDAADSLDAVFAKKWGWEEDEDELAPTPEEPPKGVVRTGIPAGDFLREHTGTPLPTVPAGTADGGASFEAEVRWALDAVKRGDRKLAEDRLKRILKGTP